MPNDYQTPNQLFLCYAYAAGLVLLQCVIFCLIILNNLNILIMRLVQMSQDDQNRCESDSGCCRIESIVSVDERGQMVLPKELREKAHIEAGDKFAVVAWERDGEICCFSLVKTDQLGGMVRNLLEPMVKAL